VNVRRPAAAHGLMPSRFVGELAITAAVVLTPAALLGCGSQAERSGPKTSAERATQTVATPRTTAFDRPPPRTAAAKAGTRACSGRTPHQIRRAYTTKATKAAGRTERKLLKAALARQAETPVPLAARLYSMTVPKPSRADAFVACAHVLFTKESSR